MKTLVSGASGLIGSALTRELEAQGHEVVRLVRGVACDARTIAWSPEKGEIEREKLEGVERVVHLSGENIAGRWSAKKMKRIRDSRVLGTRTLCSALCAMTTPPKLWLCASAVGLYGDRGDEILTEESGPGDGFLPAVCREWEGESHKASSRGVRVIHARFGIVLSREGGALAKMLTPFKLGLGGNLGNGRQYVSWISLHDAVRALCFLLDKPDAFGPFNVVSPQPVTNGEFTRELGRTLRRPTLFPVPRFVLRAVFGKMADEALLASTRAFPQKLEQAKFKFELPNLHDALRAALTQ